MKLADPAMSRRAMDAALRTFDYGQPLKGSTKVWALVCWLCLRRAGLEVDIDVVGVAGEEVEGLDRVFDMCGGGEVSE